MRAAGRLHRTACHATQAGFDQPLIGGEREGRNQT